MNKLLVTLSFLISIICVSSHTWALPPCPKDGNVYWHNCYGSYVFGSNTKWDGDKYEGEYKDNRHHGIGTYTYGLKGKWAGDMYIGQYKIGKRNGQGTYTYANGSYETGEWKEW